MDFSKLQNKKVYEFVLSSTEPSSELKNAIQSILRKAIDEPAHFQFLLNKINWFSAPYRNYMDQLQKVIRLYRGKGKEAAKVAYNLLIQNLSIQQSNKLAIQCLMSLSKDDFNQEIIIQCLKQNYPHKLCPLPMHEAYLDSLIIFCKVLPKHRFQLLQIIIENLAYFDTQLLIGDTYSRQHFPEDEKIKSLRQNAVSQIAQKYDILLRKVMDYFEKQEKDEDLLKSIFQIFQNKILPIKSTKMIQFIVYYLAQSNKNMCSKFCSLLLANILDTDIQKQNWYRIFTQSNFYLASYIIRSNKISINKIIQIINILMTYLMQKLSKIQSKQANQKLRLKQTFFQNQRNLHILQTILTTFAYQPEVKFRLGENYNQLLKQAKSKLYFDFFINQELLTSLDLIDQENLIYKQGSYRITLRYSNKFNPVILPKLGVIIDPIFKWRNPNNKYEKSYKTSKVTKKVNKDQMNFCQASDTGPSHIASQHQIKPII